jgi:hypothetical protein
MMIDSLINKGGLMVVMNIMDVRKGDIVRFKSYALRVDKEPVWTKNGIQLCGLKPITITKGN